MGVALQSVYGEIRDKGSSKDWVPLGEFIKLMGFERVWEFERRDAEVTLGTLSDWTTSTLTGC